MENNPQHSPGRKNENPAPSNSDKVTLVRRMVDLATATVKFAHAVLQLLGP